MTRGPRAGEWLVVTAAEQRRIDALAVACGASEDALVESAGRSAAEWILANLEAERAVVLAGPGGNGADALVVARCLRRSGINVESFLFSPQGPPSRSAMHALALLRDEGGSAFALSHADADSGSLTCADLGHVGEALRAADLVIDGLYGAGLSRPLDGAAATIVLLLNESGARVVSLDVPSGVAADEGEVYGPAVRADVTLAMEFLKPAHLFFPAAGLCGRTDVVEVAYPEKAQDGMVPRARVLTGDGVRLRLPKRSPAGHKGTFGHVLLVAGSAGMTGAAILAGRAALRAGTGLLTLAVPASQVAAAHAGLPEALVVSLAEESGHIVPAAVADLGAAFGRARVLAIGPGLSRDEEASAAALAVIHGFDGPVIADADALYALARCPGGVRELAGRAILTPHPGEFGTLTGIDAAEVDGNRVDVASEFATANGVIVVLKGRPTAIGFPDGKIYLNPTGHAGLAKGGSGDVLTGIVAGLLAGGASLEDAALVGPYVHGLAADLFAVHGSERSLVPSDVVELLPQAFLEVEKCA